MQNGITRLRFRQEGVMKAYSLDFREKIIDVYFIERVSVRKLAKRFGVATSFVDKLLKGLRETGDILPKPHGGGPQPKLKTEQLQGLKALVEADNDATLTELCDQLTAATSIRISRSTMGRMIQKLGFTRKKKRCTPRKRKVHGCNKLGLTIGRAFETLPRKT
jgi:transposase